MNSTIMLQRISFGDVALCVCDARRGTKGDICSNCEGAIPNNIEQAQVDDIISRINRPERKICPSCDGLNDHCIVCNGVGKVPK